MCGSVKTSMFQHHMTHFGSCASEIHKTLCYFFGGLNIFLALDILADFSTVWFEMADSQERFHGEPNEDAYRIVKFIVIAGPAVANICLAIVLIVGVYKRHPTYVRVFRMFILAQMVMICILALFSYSTVLKHRGSYTIMVFVLVISIALFGAESWIAGDYYKLLLEEIDQEEKERCIRIA